MIDFTLQLGYNREIIEIQIKIQTYDKKEKLYKNEPKKSIGVSEKKS